MRNLTGNVICSLMVVSILVLSCYPTLAFEVESSVSYIEILTPGMTRNITITQNYRFPTGCSQFLIIFIGYGGVSITVSKSNPEGDLLVLTGVGISSAGIIPFLKFGITSVTLTESIEIGDEGCPFGLLWITSWLDSSINDPPYVYYLALNF